MIVHTRPLRNPPILLVYFAEMRIIGVAPHFIKDRHMELSSKHSRQPVPVTGFLRESQIIGNRNLGVTSPLIPIDHSTLWRWVRSGHFPRPVKLRPNSTAWPAQVVADWIRTKGANYECHQRRGDMLKKCFRMMDDWANYCEVIHKEDVKVVPLRGAA